MPLYDLARNQERRKILGARLRCVREHLEPNRSEFARKVDVDVSTIRKIEDGIRGASRELLEHLAHCMGVSLDYLEWGSLNGVAPGLRDYLQTYCADALAGTVHKNEPSTSARSRWRPMVRSGNSSDMGQ